MGVTSALLIVALATGGLAANVSPVQKVVELLDECKAKVANDLAAEASAMEEYTTFCDDELKAKGYAIQTAEREINDLSATIEDSKATVAEKSDEISTLGTTIAGKEKEHYDATQARKAANADFQAAEAELAKSVDETSRAVAALSKGMAFAQMSSPVAHKQMEAVRDALKAVVGAIAIDTESSRKLKSFLQQTSAEGANDDLSLKNYQPQAKQVAYESKSGGIVQTVKDMQAKAEGELSDLRKKEMGEAHNFKMLESGLSAEITHNNEKLASATQAKSAATEAQAGAEGDLAETSTTKAADEEYSSTLHTECEETAFGWSERQKSAKEEMGAIDKAKEILVSGVTAFSQVGVAHRHESEYLADAEDRDESDEVRAKLAQKFQTLGKKFHSFALMQMAGAASSDPFVKIRGLIEDMLTKLINEANEEATQKAFCDEEQGKSRAAQKEKTAKADNYQTRIDQGSATIAELSENVKTLEAEIAEIDSAQAEATKIRTTENVQNTKAMVEFKESADAVIRATGVLKSYYSGALIQTGAQTHSKQPAFGGAKSDTGSSIISVLEVAESDFTRLFAETETEEDQAAAAFKKLSDENKISRATKEADAKGKGSEIKSLTVQVSHHKEDHASVSDELDAVNSYLEKLRPQCESKAMSYAEKKAAREAEISGLKEALEILEGKGVAMLFQSEKKFLPFRRA